MMTAAHFIFFFFNYDSLGSIGFVTVSDTDGGPQSNANYNTYDVGSAVRLIGAFNDIDEDAVDPTTVIVRVKDPSGNVTTPAVTNDATGVYHADVVLSLPGNYYYRFEGSGSLIAVADAQINVTPSQVLGS